MIKTKKKICLVASSLGKGGAERATAYQSLMLTDLGYEVFLVIVNSIVEYDYSGALLDLGELKKNGIGRFSRLQYFKKFLLDHNFFAIIDNRSRTQAYRELIISKWLYKTPTIYVIHSFEKGITFSKYKMLNHFLYKNQLMVGVSTEISKHFKNLYKLNHIETIHNAFDFISINKKGNETIEENESIKSPYIIFYGRVDNASKNLNLLLQAYKDSKLISKGVKLLILGNGPDTEMLKTYSKELKIYDSIIFKNAVKNPFPYVKNALFKVLTSNYEGFPMVLVESLSLGTPVVSVNCKSGPSEIINHGFNGLLIENYDVLALSKAMDNFIFDTDLYNKCKANAKESVTRFSLNRISKDWQALLITIT